MAEAVDSSRSSGGGGGIDDTISESGTRASTLLERGRTVGRYVVLDLVGVGGMSHVYAAYDPELDRRVALKVMATTVASPGSVGRERARILREAQAMARLAHQNVVGVHDVGTVDERVFLAMHFVEGETLTEWLRKRPLQDAVIDTFLQAGRGLAAAHSVGIVHRDFKPDNVLIDREGIVRVTDFGLARTDMARDSEAPRIDPADLELATSSTSRLRSPIVTHPGVVMGTPAYMPPEQHMLDAVDARADQFSFCVALWEALFGERPFAGETVAEISYSVAHGEVRPFPPGTSVPPRIRRALVRGLSRKPADRFATMDALLAELVAVRGGRRRVRLALAGAALVGVGALGVWLLGPRPSPCREADASVIEAYNDERIAAIQAAFAQTGRMDAGAATRHVTEALGVQATAIARSRRDACEAARVRGELSGEAYDARVACLDRRTNELRVFVDAFTQADDRVVERSLGFEPADAFTPVTECDDVERLQEEHPLPDDPIARAEIETLERELDELRAADLTGMRVDASAAELVAEATRVGFLPLEARARQILSHQLEQTGDLAAAEREMYAALEVAAKSKYDRVAAIAWMDLLYLVGVKQRRFAEAKVIAEAGRLAVLRLASPYHENMFLVSLGGVQQMQGDLGGARDTYKRALELMPEDAPFTRRMVVLNNLGSVALQQSHVTEARTYLEQALEIAQERLGAGSTLTVDYHFNLALADLMVGRYASALAGLDRAAAVLSATGIRDRVRQANHEVARAAALNGLGRHDEARAAGERGLELAEAAGHNPLLAAEGWIAVANAERSQRRFDAAERALGRAEAMLAADAAGEAFSSPLLQEQGRLELDRGRPDAAKVVFERALALVQPEAPDLAVRAVGPLLGLGLAKLALADPAGAERTLARARELVATIDVAPELQGELAFASARAIADSGGSRAEAMELARTAATRLAAAENPVPPRADVDTWLREHGEETR